jgi:hypothetical protein
MRYLWPRSRQPYKAVAGHIGEITSRPGKTWTEAEGLVHRFHDVSGYAADSLARAAVMMKVTIPARTLHRAPAGYEEFRSEVGDVLRGNTKVSRTQIPISSVSQAIDYKEQKRAVFTNFAVHKKSVFETGKGAQ